MAIRFESGEYLARTSNVINYNAAYSTCFWARIVTDQNAFTHFWAISYQSDPDTTVAWHNSDFIGTDSDGTTLRAGAVIGAAGAFLTGSALTAGTWYHLAAVRESATVLKIYLNGVLDITANLDITGRTAVAGEFVAEFNLTPGDARICAYKQWSAALTAAEIINEMRTYVPRRLASIYKWSPMLAGATERLRDYGGSPYNWTATGTLSDEDGPPISWGGGSLYMPFSAAAAVGGKPFLYYQRMQLGA